MIELLSKCDPNRDVFCTAFGGDFQILSVYGKHWGNNPQWRDDGREPEQPIWIDIVKIVEK